MRPPGMGPYPPGYTPKFPVPIPKSNPDKESKTTESQNNEEFPSSSNITEYVKIPYFENPFIGSIVYYYHCLFLLAARFEKSFYLLLIIEK